MAASGNALVSLLAETDFVAKNEAFMKAAQQIAEAADANKAGDLETLKAVSLGDKTVEGVPAIVLNSGGQSLLGQTFLSKFASVHIEDDKMILR